jgi:hypothetical protein
MNEHGLEARLRAAYRSEADRADPGALAERVHSIPASVAPERRRWWHALRAAPARRAGLAETYLRGGGGMLSAARIVLVVGALMLGTSFLAVQVGDPPDNGAPAAAPASSPAPASAPNDEARATYVTGTAMPGNRTVHVATHSRITNLAPPFTDTGGVYERDVTWSDPRLPSLMRIAENWSFYPVEDRDGIDGAMQYVQRIRLDGPDGSWTGPGYALVEEIPDGHYPQTVLMILEGQQAYEGLSAMLRATYDEPPEAGEIPSWDGYIFEGELTAMPDPPEAPPSGG